MKILARIVGILKKPFPGHENRVSYFKNVIFISLFIAFFLYIFQPFGLSEFEGNTFLICLGFGAMTLLSQIFYFLIVNRIPFLNDQSKNFTFGKWIIVMTGLLMIISVANFAFARAFIERASWVYLPRMVFATVAVGIFPTVLVGAISLSRQERKYQSISSEINDKIIEAIDPDNHSQQSLFGIGIDQIKYVEALQNYVRIGFINEGGQFSEKMERATLKSLSDSIAESSIVKCHRSFLVNSNSIISTSGNAQGLILALSDCPKEIPVSRTYVKDFR